MRRPRDNGIALVIALVLTAFFAVVGLGLVFTVSVDRLGAMNHEDQARALYAADAALALAASELARTGDFDAVLEGRAVSAYTDGESAGLRVLSGGGAVDLVALTGELSCGRSAGCTDAQVAVSTAARPWGANNPRWRPYVYLPLADVVGPAAGSLYIAVWIGDDATETDGEPAVDGGGDAGAGRGVLRAHAEAFGRLGARHAVEAELARVCVEPGAGAGCLPGIRVQSWRQVADRLP
ncbi:MAG: PilX N-terminal domain-containing pilus assembly protein [Vicinamibacterales bacterium]